MSNISTYGCIQEYTLIAQTPLIHFQAAQDGATLRATEVKPKLDKFLHRRITEKIDTKGWFIKDTEALNYKLQFKASEPRSKPIDIGKGTPYDIYYGNMGETMVQAMKSNVKMTVICANSELMKFIRDNLNDFFIVTNFGRMQSKGFGSFIIQGEDDFYSDSAITKALKKEYGAKEVYYFSGGNDRLVFKRIKIIYTLMKSGSILSTPPCESLLFSYLEGKDLINERTWLKKEIVARRPQSRGKYRYVRALFGVGDHINLRKPVITSFKLSNSEIERLASPIFFKVFPDESGNLYVYFVATRICEDIYGKCFAFTSDRGSGECCVPTKAELGGDSFVDDFLEYCYDQFNRDNDNMLDRFRETRNIGIFKGEASQNE